MPYYFNARTKESRWEPPAEADTEKLKVYMAKHHSHPADRYGSAGQNEGKIRASHLLIKHRGSRRPSSWREAKITRTKEEALEILRGHEARIKSGEATLGDIAMSESDCSSARKKGDLSVGENLSGSQITDLFIVDSLAAARCNLSLKKRHSPSNLVK